MQIQGQTQLSFDINLFALRVCQTALKAQKKTT